jgi:hypothetical protein
MTTSVNSVCDRLCYKKLIARNYLHKIRLQPVIENSNGIFNELHVSIMMGHQALFDSRLYK